MHHLNEELTQYPASHNPDFQWQAKIFESRTRQQGHDLSLADALTSL